MPEPSVAEQLAHPPLSIEYRDPRALAANPENYRHHPPEQISEIKRSLQDLGQYRNVVCRPDGTLLAGHGVVQAAIDLGWEQIAVHVFTGSEAKARRLMVADNELSRGAEDDERALHALLNEINRDFGDLAGTGWSDAEHEAQMAELAAEDFGLAKAEQEDPGAGEVPEEPQTRLGDVWLCGEHRVVCGDSTDPESYAGCPIAQLVATSPPYAKQREYELEAFDWDGVVPLVIATACEHLADDGSALVNLGLVHEDGRVIEYWRSLFEMMEAKERPLFGWYVWDKLDGLPGDWNGRLRPAHEWIFHFAHKPRRPQKTKECKHAGHVITYAGMRREDGSMSDWTGLGDAVGSHKEPDSVIRCTPAKGGVADHPAPFSVAFAVELVEPYTEAGECVIDPFLGSGTTLIAAEKLGRVCYGIELEPRYCDVALRRWARMTGEAPTLEATGEEFEV